MLTPPPESLNVLRHIQHMGRQAYFVGGCVRDSLLNVTPKDWDIATDATPGEIMSWFPSVTDPGSKFGSVIVGHTDVTTFRHEGVYTDGRHPGSVSWGKTVEEDAVRRDFTINAIYWDPIADVLQDPVGGYGDLHARRLIAVGDPEERMKEDYLRILRGCRFAAKYKLSVGNATMKAMYSLAFLCKGLPVERTSPELMEIAWNGPTQFYWIFNEVWGTNYTRKDFHQVALDSVALRKAGCWDPALALHRMPESRTMVMEKSERQSLQAFDALQAYHDSPHRHWDTIWEFAEFQGMFGPGNALPRWYLAMYGDQHGILNKEAPAAPHQFTGADVTRLPPTSARREALKAARRMAIEFPWYTRDAILAIVQTIFS